jgi:predicted nuclease with TOPRIM domain
MIGPWNKIGFRQIAFGGGGGGGGTNTPLETTISNQPHALAYITPSEEGLLRSLGGTGQAGPGGVPAFPPAEGGDSTRAADLKAAKAAGGGGGGGSKKASNSMRDPNQGRGDSTLLADRKAAKAAAEKAAAAATPPPEYSDPIGPPPGKESTPGTPATPIPEGLKPPDGAAGLTLPAYQTWTNMDTGEDATKPYGWTAPNANWTTNPDKWTEDKAVADAAAAEAAAETKRLADEASAAAEAARQVKIKELEDQLSASQGLYGELQDKYGKTQEEYTGLKSNFEELFGNYGTLTGTYDDQKAAYDDLYGQYDTLESQLGDYNTQLADQKSNYESLLDEYTGLQGQYGTTTDEYGTLKDQYGNVVSELGTVRDEYGTLKDQYGNVVDEFGRLKNQFGTLDEQYQNQLGLYDTLQSDFSGLQGTLAEQQAAYETQKAAAEKNRVLGIAEKATSGAARPDPRYTQPAQTATPAYTPVAANQGAQSLTPGATTYGIAPINYAANMPDFMNNPVNLNVPSFGATGQNAPPPIGGPMQQVTPMMDYSAPFQPYLQSINQQYGVNIPSAYTGIMAGGRQ